MERFKWNFNPSSLIISAALCVIPLLANASVNPDLVASQHYKQHNLVSDGANPADHTDPHLVNPWGIAFGPTSPVWIANNGSGTSTLYNGQGVAVPLVVTIPTASGGGVGTPTGIVFNNTTGWVIKSAGKSSPAVFIFATEDGTISGWAPTVNRTNAIIAVNDSATGATYTGLARGANGTNVFLYAANLWSGKVDVFNSGFKPVNSGGFVDPLIPVGFAPFNVQNINGDIYVTYAKQDATKRDVIKAVGQGIVDLYNANGKLIRRIATGGPLNAPWGVAIAPGNFGKFSNALLVGNFGDGKINAYDLTTNAFLGQLTDASGTPLAIDGLWALSFGNGLNDQPTNVLYFSAGPDDEMHGLYGTIKPA